MQARKYRLWNLETHGITQGALNAFMQCPRKAHYSLKMGLESARGHSQALDYGILVHDIMDLLGSALEKPTTRGKDKAWVSGVINECVGDWFEDRTTGFESTQELQDLDEVCTWACAVLPQYFFYWEETQPISWESTEEEFAITEKVDGEDVVLRGKIDGSFRCGNSLWMAEHKTRSRVSPDAIAKSLPFDTQVCLYAWTLQQLAQEPVKGVLYNIIRRPSKRPHKDENMPDYMARLKEDVADRPDFYFMRFEMALIQDDIEQWVSEMKEVVREVRRWNAGEFNYRNPNGCQYCPFIGLCSGSGSVSDLKRKKKPFPELDEDPMNILNERSVEL